MPNNLNKITDKKGNKDQKLSNKKKSNSLDDNQSKIPVYNFSAKSKGTLPNRPKFNTVNNQNKNGKFNINANMLADLPENIKLLHHIHNQYTHAEAAHHERKFSNRSHISHSKTTLSLQTNSPCTSGTYTPKEADYNGPNSNLSSGSRKKNKFEDYLPLCEMQKGLQKGEIIEGILRINPKNYKDAYISAPGGGLDIFLNGLISRNRALNGDRVAVKLIDSESWTISYSAINCYWNKWENDFKNIIASKSKDQEDITIKLEDLKLNSQDSKIIDIQQQIIKNESNTNSKYKLKKLFEKEYPNIPYELLFLNLSDFLKLDFSNQFIQRSGKVVFIMEKNHSRIAGGIIRVDDIKNQYAHFISNDLRVPHVFIPVKSLPKSFVCNYELAKNNLFLVKIIDWQASSYYPRGEILEILGECTNIDSQTQVLLKSYDIDTNEFPPEALSEYNTFFSQEKWTIPLNEYSYRRDFRNECVFTIDPQSARDLDDAISIKILQDDRYEIGVHIADVSYFIKEGTDLDNIAKNRATSVYLVDKVIPMLPPLFCQNLCSLTAGEDKLTFSVVFICDNGGHIYDKWFGRTLINSCAKLSYEHAQKMINSTNEDFVSEEFPEIFGNWSLKDISFRIKKLDKIAKAIRNRRFSTGSLRFNKSKLSFNLDSNGLPICFSLYEIKDSNQLIEELMLMANKAVAERLYDCFAKEGRAFLRSHPPPNQYNLFNFINFCENMSIDFDTSNSLNIHNSLQLLDKDNPIYHKLCMMYLIKAMKLAIYNCVHESDDLKDFRHYALNFDKYTHFTSPIRRYADVIVHRLLSASLGYDTVCSQRDFELKQIANNCNQRKFNAYVVSEQSSEIYLKAYISQVGFFVTKAIVSNVYDHSFDVLTIDLSIFNRVYLDQLSLESFELTKVDKRPELKLKWKPIDSDSGENTNLEQTISIFSELDVEITVNDKFNFIVIIAHPNGQFIRISS